MRVKVKILLLLLAISGTVSAQLGIRAGVNMSEEIRSFSQEDIKNGFKSENLTGYQIGLTYQMMPNNTGIGAEVGLLLNQRGSTFQFDDTNIFNSVIKGYKEMNYIDIPFNVRGRIYLGTISVYGTAGIYGSYALGGKTVFEVFNQKALTEKMNFNDFQERLDYGVSLGTGIEVFNRLQFGVSWNRGLKTNETDKTILDKLKTASKNPLSTSIKSIPQAFTVNVVYLF